MNVAAVQARRGTLTRRPRTNTYRRKGTAFRDLFSTVKGLFIFVLQCLSISGLIALVTLGVLVGHRYLTSHPYFGLKHVEIQGHQHRDYGEILELARLEMGENTLSIDMGNIRNRILHDPWVREVEVKRLMPDSLVISIVERQPVFLIQHDDRIFYAGTDGRPFAPVEGGGFVSLPVLHIQKGAEIFRNKLEGVVTALEEKRLPFGMADIDWIVLTPSSEARMYLQKSGLEVTLDLESVELNLQRLRAVWQDLRQKKLFSGVDKVTVFKGSVLVEQREADQN